jgi:uncharacterized membrane protein (UPF0127 family)
MPKSNVAKTALARNVLVALLLIFTVLLLLPKPAKMVQLNNKKIKVEVVNKEEELKKGLSGRQSLPSDAGMLFELGDSDQACIWMKDMQFAIDVVWLDSTKMVIDAATDVAPSTYPNTFCPKEKAQYILEVPAGTTYKNSWKIGQQASF